MPSGGTGAGGGGYNLFRCRNHYQEGHPDVWISSNGGLCTHCQVSHSATPHISLPLNHASARIRVADNEKQRTNTSPS